jgi:branched-chain amino acid transport system substrate-binding protein
LIGGEIMRKHSALRRTLLLSSAAAAVTHLHAAEVGVETDEIVVGQSAALSGNAQELGTEMKLGAQILFDKVNEAGGIFGRKIRLITLDDAYEPDKASANTKKLIEEEKVFALFGYVGTPTSNKAIELSKPAKVPFFGAFTGTESLRNPFERTIFNVRASYFDETEKIVEQLTSLGTKSIAVFYQNDAYGKTGLDGVERALAKRNMKITATATVERNTINVADAVKFLVPKKPDAIVMISAYTSITPFVKEAKKAGYTGQFHNVSFVGSSALSRALGPDGYGVAISQVVPFPYTPDTAIVREYQLELKKRSSRTPSFTSLEGFISAKAFVEGLRRAGKDLTREKFIAGLETMNNFDMGGFNINFTPTNHNGSKFVELTIIGKEGKFIR